MKKRKILLICLIFLFALCGCEEEEEEKTLRERIEEEKAIIVDVRTKEEYLESHIKGAINIPYDEIDENIGLDKNKKIYVYCKSGTRSGIAYENLKSLGYEVENLGAYQKINLERTSEKNENTN